MSAETLSAAAGILLSLAAAYVPPFATWFSQLDGAHKRLVMLGLLALAALGSFLLECSGWSASGTPLAAFLAPAAARCTPPMAMEVLRAFIAALVANQAAYQLSPCSQAHPAKTEDEWLEELDFFDEEDE